MSPSAAPEPEAPRRMPPQLAEQLTIITAQLIPGAAILGQVMLSRIDASLLNICEIAEVDMALMNRVLALRVAAEQYAQVIDGPPSGGYAERETARAKAEKELGALEEVLHAAQPSGLTKTMGDGW